jgi:hypothetical protein
MTAGELQTSVEQGLLAIHPAGLDDYFEIRILRHDNRVDSGYFTDAACAADAVDQHIESGVGANYYVTLNPINPARIDGRRINRIERGATRTTRDADVLWRRWMLVDIDPVRPVDLSSTDAELAHSRICRDAVVEWLRSQVWPEPVLAMSGNGYHALYPIDLAPDDASTERLKRVLTALAHQFSNPHVTVDVTVHNLSRICKVYGTRARKGPATPDRPHRLADLEVLQ